MLMNSDFVIARARKFAERIAREAGEDLRAQVVLAWKLAFAAQPSAEEITNALAFVEHQSANFPEQPAEATASFCQALLSSNQFLYID